MARCILKIQTIESPVMGDYRGLRVVVALPNKAGYNMLAQKHVPSFEKPYRLAVFGDFVDGADVLANMDKVIKKVHKMGFKDIEYVQ